MSEPTAFVPKEVPPTPPGSNREVLETMFRAAGIVFSVFPHQEPTYPPQVVAVFHIEGNSQTQPLPGWESPHLSTDILFDKEGKLLAVWPSE